MRVLSLFSGMGGFDLALERAGMEIVGQAENDRQCRRVLAAHWPEIARTDDVRGVGLGRTQHYVEGEPDDDETAVADAAWRAGDVDLICGGFPCQDVSVAGRRAGLDGARSGLWFEFQRIVSGLRPAYVLVENVPGILSSNRGRDFAAVIGGLGDCGYAVSWAILDAQHFGVPQRRRRVFIVGGPDPGRTEAILALAEGCAGHPEPRRAPGQDLAGDALAGVAKSLRARTNASHREDSDTYIPEVVPQAMSSKWSKGSGGPAGDEVSNIVAVRTAQTGASEDGTGRRTPLVAQPLRADRWGGSDSHGDQGNAVSAGMDVRRLTPTECLRLQGFPDDWLDIDPPLADGPKYRMCGNAVAVPVVEWIGRRIMEVAG